LGSAQYLMEKARTAGLTTYKRSLRTEIEIGTWGTLCTVVLFVGSACAALFGYKGAWISELGIATGIVTMAAILVRSHLAAVAARARRAVRAIRKAGTGPDV